MLNLVCSCLVTKRLQPGLEVLAPRDLTQDAQWQWFCSAKIEHFPPYVIISPVPVALSTAKKGRSGPLHAACHSLAAALGYGQLIT
jgi:hypothetical protein